MEQFYHLEWNKESMEVINFNIKGLKLIKPEIFHDERGYFLETYNSKRYKDILENKGFVQAGHSFSKKNVLRGIHFQKTKPQEQLFYLSSGKIFYVAVDFRPNSKTFLDHISLEIESSDHSQIFTPRGVGSAYYTLTDNVNLIYKISQLYGENEEEGVIWNDPTLNIEWPCLDPIVSKKDQSNKLVSQIDFSLLTDLKEL